MLTVTDPYVISVGLVAFIPLKVFEITVALKDAACSFHKAKSSIT